MSALSSDAVLIDCGERVTGSVQPRLATVTALARGDDVELTACTTSLDPVSRVPSRSSATVTASVMVRATSEVGPVVVRRVAGDTARDVRIRFEFAGGVTDVTAVWSDDHYDLRVEARSSSASGGDGQVRLLPAAPPPSVIPATFVRDLPDDLSMPEQMVADKDGLVVLSECRYGEGNRWQVHRMAWADGRVTELVPAEATWAYGVLAADGSRLVSRHGSAPAGEGQPYQLTAVDLRTKARQRIDCADFGTGDAFDVRVADTGTDLFVAGLRTPILRFDRAGKWSETIPSERNDRLTVNGRYLGRIGGPQRGVDVYDLVRRRWSRTLENPYGATQVYPSPDGELVCCGDIQWCVLDVASGNLAAPLQRGPNDYGQGETAVFSPDGRWLARVGFGALLLDLDDRAAPRSVKVGGIEDRQGTLAAFSSDGRQLVLLQSRSLYTVPLKPEPRRR